MPNYAKQGEMLEKIGRVQELQSQFDVLHESAEVFARRGDDMRRLEAEAAIEAANQEMYALGVEP